LNKKIMDAYSDKTISGEVLTFKPSLLSYYKRLGAEIGEEEYFETDKGTRIPYWPTSRPPQEVSNPQLPASMQT